MVFSPLSLYYALAIAGYGAEGETEQAVLTALGVESREAGERIARHEVACTFADIAACARFFLRWGGKFCCCQRPERLPAVMAELSRAGLEPKRLRLVQQRPQKAPFLFLLEAVRGAKPGLRVEPVLFVEGDAGGWSQEILGIYGTYKEGRI